MKQNIRLIYRNKKFLKRTRLTSSSFWFLIFIFVDITFSYEERKEEKVEFQSANPFSFFHIITDLENQQPQKAYGILRFPDQESDKKYSLILGVNGSKNWADHHLEYMRMYRKMGYATFEIQSFNSRNVNSLNFQQLKTIIRNFNWWKLGSYGRQIEMDIMLYFVGK